MTDQPADSYNGERIWMTGNVPFSDENCGIGGLPIGKEKPNPIYKICTCCQIPFYYTKKWNDKILEQDAIKRYGDTVVKQEGVEICKKCWDGLEKPEEENAN